MSEVQFVLRRIIKGGSSGEDPEHFPPDFAQLKKKPDPDPTLIRKAKIILIY